MSPTKSNGISPKVNTFRALEYYICSPSCCVDEVAKALIRAAARGVSCRVLVAHGYWKHADAVIKLVDLGKLIKAKMPCVVYSSPRPAQPMSNGNISRQGELSPMVSGRCSPGT